MRLKFLPLMLALPTLSTAQKVYDTVDLGANSNNVVFYSLENGTLKTSDNTDWHIAFKVIPMNGPTGGVGVFANHNAGGVSVYSSGKAKADYASITLADTADAYSNDPLYNSFEDWGIGAFNIDADPNSPFDYGWGKYDMSDHNVHGDSVYIVKAGGVAYKVFIEQYMSNPADSVGYIVHVGDLNNATDQTLRIYNNPDFTKRHLAYVNLSTLAILDKEPDFGTWDLQFGKYYDWAGTTPYGVNGVVSSPGVEVAKAEGIDPDDAQYTDYTFVEDKNAIGYDWKSFTGGAYVYDTLTSYFVKTHSNDIWQVGMNYFSGNAGGQMGFWKVKVMANSIHEVNSPVTQFAFVPNPVAGGQLNIVLDATRQANDVNLTVVDMTGRVVLSKSINVNAGLNAYQMRTDVLVNGQYFAIINSGDWKHTGSFIVAK